ncbi:MAG: oligosaccharide flippase family protein [Actinomycetota bacterium]
MTRVARNTTLIAIGQASVKATQLVLAVLLVRLMSPAEWNEAAFLLSIYLAGTTIGNLNLHHGIVFFLPRVEAGKRRNLVMQNVRLLLAMGTIIMLGLIAAKPLFVGGALGDGNVLPWLGLAIALELPAACFGMTLIGLERFVGVAIWDLAGTVLVLSGAIMPVLAGYGVAGLVMGLIVAGAIRFLSGVLLVYRSLPGSAGGLGRAFLLEQLRYGIPLGATIAVAMLNRLVDKWFIAAFESDDFGIYAVAAQEVPLLAVLPYAGGAALITKLVDAFHERDLAGARAHWIQLTSSMSLLVAPLGVGLILIAPDLIPSVFGREFAAGVLPFQLFTAVTVHRVAEYGMLLRAAGKTRELLIVASVTLGSNFVLAGFGAWAGGMTGSAVGTLVASAIGWLTALHFIGQALDVSVRRAFPWARWLSAVGVSTAAACAAYLVAVPADVTSMARAALQLAVFLVLVVPGMRFLARTEASLPPDGPTERPPAAMRSLI